MNAPKALTSTKLTLKSTFEIHTKSEMNGQKETWICNG